MKGNLMEFENEIKNIQNDAEKLNADIQERLNKNQHHNQLIRKKTQEIKKMQENIKKMKNDKLIIKNAMIEILMDCRVSNFNRNKDNFLFQSIVKFTYFSILKLFLYY